MAVDDMFLLDALIKESSENNMMSSRDIAKYLEEIGRPLNEQTVRRRMRAIVRFEDAFSDDQRDDEEIQGHFQYELPDGGVIHYRVTDNAGKKLLSNFWYESAFPIAEAKMKYLLDTVLYSPILTEQEVQDLCQKILEVSKSKELVEITRERIELIRKSRTYRGNVDVLEQVVKIQKAIDQRKKIQFFLNVYRYKNGIKPEHTSVWARTVSPFKILMSNGRYYLIGHHAGLKDGGYRIYRIDLIDKLKVLNNEPITAKEPAELCNRNLPNYVMANPYMYGGEIEPVTFLMDEEQFTQFVDWFGDQYESISERTYTADDARKDQLEITIKVNVAAFSFWAMQYSECVTVLKPESLRTVIMERLKETLDRYQNIDKEDKA